MQALSHRSWCEIDLVLELPGRDGLWAIEIKRGVAPKIERGFHLACDDIKPNRKFVIYSGNSDYLLSPGLEAVSLKSLMDKLAGL